MNDSSDAGVRYASQSLSREGYPCAQPWPADCFVQCGGGGVVFSSQGSYRTAFFEAFPSDPKCFLRGEGSTIVEAEAACWRKWQSILACPGHDFDRRDRRDGYAWCRHCSYASTAFEPLDHCVVCGVPACYGQDKHGQVYCETHYESMPRELWDKLRNEYDLMRDEVGNEPEPTPEEVAASLAAVIRRIRTIEDEAVEGKRTVSGIEDFFQQVQDGQ